MDSGSKIEHYQISYKFSDALYIHVKAWLPRQVNGVNVSVETHVYKVESKNISLVGYSDANTSELCVLKA